MSQRCESELFREVYDDLRRRARRLLADERVTSRQTVDLVNSACRKVLASSRKDVSSPSKLKAITVRAMRQLLVESARKRGAAKRADPEVVLSLTSEPEAEQDLFSSALVFEDVLVVIGRNISPRAACVLELKAGGMMPPEMAEALGVSVRSVQRDLKAIKVWMKKHLAS